MSSKRLSEGSGDEDVSSVPKVKAVHYYHNSQASCRTPNTPTATAVTWKRSHGIEDVDEDDECEVRTSRTGWVPSSPQKKRKSRTEHVEDHLSQMALAPEETLDGSFFCYQGLPFASSQNHMIPKPVDEATTIVVNNRSKKGLSHSMKTMVQKLAKKVLTTQHPHNNNKDKRNSYNGLETPPRVSIQKSSTLEDDNDLLETPPKVFSHKSTPPTWSPSPHPSDPQSAFYDEFGVYDASPNNTIRGSLFPDQDDPIPTIEEVIIDDSMEEEVSTTEIGTTTIMDYTPPLNLPYQPKQRNIVVSTQRTLGHVDWPVDDSPEDFFSTLQTDGEASLAIVSVTPSPNRDPTTETTEAEEADEDFDLNNVTIATTLDGSFAFQQHEVKFRDKPAVIPEEEVDLDITASDDGYFMPQDAAVDYSMSCNSLLQPPPPAIGKSSPIEIESDTFVSAPIEMSDTFGSDCASLIARPKPQRMSDCSKNGAFLLPPPPQQHSVRQGPVSLSKRSGLPPLPPPPQKALSPPAQHPQPQRRGTDPVDMDTIVDLYDTIESTKDSSSILNDSDFQNAEDWVQDGSFFRTEVEESLIPTSEKNEQIQVAFSGPPEYSGPVETFGMDDSLAWTKEHSFAAAPPPPPPPQNEPSKKPLLKLPPSDRDSPTHFGENSLLLQHVISKESEDWTEDMNKAKSSMQEGGMPTQSDAWTEGTGSVKSSLQGGDASTKSDDSTEDISTAKSSLQEDSASTQSEFWSANIPWSNPFEQCKSKPRSDPSMLFQMTPVGDSVELGVVQPKADVAKWNDVDKSMEEVKAIESKAKISNVSATSEELFKPSLNVVSPDGEQFQANFTSVDAVAPDAESTPTQGYQEATASAERPTSTSGVKPLPLGKRPHRRPPPAFSATRGSLSAVWEEPRARSAKDDTGPVDLDDSVHTSSIEAYSGPVDLDNSFESSSSDEDKGPVDLDNSFESSSSDEEDKGPADKYEPINTIKTVESADASNTNKEKDWSDIIGGIDCTDSDDSQVCYAEVTAPKRSKPEGSSVSDPTQTPLTDRRGDSHTHRKSAAESGFGSQTNESGWVDFPKASKTIDIPIDSSRSSFLESLAAPCTTIPRHPKDTIPISRQLAQAIQRKLEDAKLFKGFAEDAGIECVKESTCVASVPQVSGGSMSSPTNKDPQNSKISPTHKEPQTQQSQSVKITISSDQQSGTKTEEAGSPMINISANDKDTSFASCSPQNGPVVTMDQEDSDNLSAPEVALPTERIMYDITSDNTLSSQSSKEHSFQARASQTFKPGSFTQFQRLDSSASSVSAAEEDLRHSEPSEPEIDSNIGEIDEAAAEEIQRFRKICMQRAMNSRLKASFSKPSFEEDTATSSMEKDMEFAKKNYEGVMSEFEECFDRNLPSSSSDQPRESQTVESEKESTSDASETPASKSISEDSLAHMPASVVNEELQQQIERSLKIAAEAKKSLDVTKLREEIKKLKATAAALQLAAERAGHISEEGESQTAGQEPAEGKTASPAKSLSSTSSSVFPLDESGEKSVSFSQELAQTNAENERNSPSSERRFSSASTESSGNDADDESGFSLGDASGSSAGGPASPSSTVDNAKAHSSNLNLSLAPPSEDFNVMDQVHNDSVENRELAVVTARESPETVDSTSTAKIQNKTKKSVTKRLMSAISRMRPPPREYKSKRHESMTPHGVKTKVVDQIRRLRDPSKESPFDSDEEVSPTRPIAQSIDSETAGYDFGECVEPSPAKSIKAETQPFADFAVFEEEEQQKEVEQLIDLFLADFSHCYSDDGKPVEEDDGKPRGQFKTSPTKGESAGQNTNKGSADSDESPSSFSEVVAPTYQPWTSAKKSKPLDESDSSPSSLSEIVATAYGPPTTPIKAQATKQVAKPSLMKVPSDESSEEGIFEGIKSAGSLDQSSVEDGIQESPTFDDSFCETALLAADFQKEDVFDNPPGSFPSHPITPDTVHFTSEVEDATRQRIQLEERMLSFLLNSAEVVGAPPGVVEAGHKPHKPSQVHPKTTIKTSPNPKEETTEIDTSAPVTPQSRPSVSENHSAIRQQRLFSESNHSKEQSGELGGSQSEHSEKGHNDGPPRALSPDPHFDHLVESLVRAGNDSDRSDPTPTCAKPAESSTDSNDDGHVTSMDYSEHSTSINGSIIVETVGYDDEFSVMEERNSILEIKRPEPVEKPVNTSCCSLPTRCRSYHNLSISSNSSQRTLPTRTKSSREAKISITQNESAKADNSRRKRSKSMGNIVYGSSRTTPSKNDSSASSASDGGSSAFTVIQNLMAGSLPTIPTIFSTTSNVKEEQPQKPDPMNTSISEALSVECTYEHFSGSRPSRTSSIQDCISSIPEEPKTVISPHSKPMHQQTDQSPAGVMELNSFFDATLSLDSSGYSNDTDESSIGNGPRSIGSDEDMEGISHLDHSYMLSKSYNLVRSSTPNRRERTQRARARSASTPNRSQNVDSSADNSYTFGSFGVPLFSDMVDDFKNMI